MTATPVRLNGDGLGDVNDKLIVGVSAKWLIENSYLAPYDYNAPDISYINKTQHPECRHKYKPDIAADSYAAPPVQSFAQQSAAAADALGPVDEDLPF